MANGVIRCVNCETLPKQHINKETNNIILKCPNCKIKTGEYATHEVALKEWNRIHTHTNKE